jgi:APA family basic amino acid/polyamine antiporter
MSAAPQTSEDSGFRQHLGLFDATMLVAGSMIGSGIFIVSADISRDVGSAGWLLFIWALTGVMTIIGALSFAELAAMMPNAGGQYIYLREAYGPLPAFLYGWTNFLIIQTGFIAAVSVAFAKFLAVLVPDLGTGTILWTTPQKLVAVTVAVGLTFLNCLGVREGKWVQNIFTVAKTAGLVLLIVVGLTVARNSEAVTTNGQDVWNGIVQSPQYEKMIDVVPITGLAVVLVLCGAMVGALFSSDAWGNVTFTAGEIKNPRRNLPSSLVLGTGMVIGLYLLANLAYLSALPIQPDAELQRRLAVLDRLEAKLEKANKAKEAEAVREEKKNELALATTTERGIALARDDRVATAVMEIASPDLGVTVMAIAIMISTFGCVNGIVLSGSRLYYAMARDGLFFQSVGRLNARGVPAAGLIMQGLWSILLIFSGSYSELLDYVIFAALLFYVVTVAALFVLRRKRPDWPRPYRAIGYPVLPAIYIGLCATIMIGLLIAKPIYSWPSFIIILAGIPLYWLWRSRSVAVGSGSRQ